MIAIKLKFRSPVHVGVDSLDSASVVVHSDTLFGAIGSVLPRLGIDTEDFVTEMGEARISSLFPFDDGTYYLPKPLNANSRVLKVFRESAEDYSLAKKFRKAQLLPKEAFEMVVFGNVELERLGNLIRESLPAKVFDLPKVALDRVTSNSNIFYVSQLHFKEGAGLYFLYDGNKKVLNDYILPAVKFLGDEGLGGKRSWGLGLFDVEVDRSFTLKTPREGDEYVTLSLVLPKSKDEITAWEPVRRSGWIHTTAGEPRRKPTMLFAVEGSIVKRDAGRILDLDEIGPYSQVVGHKVHVYGLAFPIPLGGEP